MLQQYLFFSFRILILTNGEFYTVKRYIHIVKEGAKEHLFDVPVRSMRRARQYVSEQGASRRQEYRDRSALYFVGMKRKLEQ